MCDVENALLNFKANSRLLLAPILILLHVIRDISDKPSQYLELNGQDPRAKTKATTDSRECNTKKIKVNLILLNRPCKDRTKTNASQIG